MCEQRPNLRCLKNALELEKRLDQALNLLGNRHLPLDDPGVIEAGEFIVANLPEISMLRPGIIRTDLRDDHGGTEVIVNSPDDAVEVFTGDPEKDKRLRGWVRILRWPNNT